MALAFKVNCPSLVLSGDQMLDVLAVVADPPSQELYCQRARVPFTATFT